MARIHATPVRFHFAIGAAVAFLVGCYLPTMYSGDGTISRPVQGVYGYKVDLGKLDLGRRNEVERALSGLPREGFTIGLEVVRKRSASSDTVREPPLRARVRMRLANERGEVVVYEEGPLNEWIWTAAPGGPYDYAFVYRRGLDIEIPEGKDGSVRVVRGPTRPDGGWGTSFEPRRRGKYELSIEILASDPNALNFEVRLVANGGLKGSL